MSRKSPPRLAITMGDPAGIGAEVIVRSWGDPHLLVATQRIVVGSPAVIKRAVELIGGPWSVRALEDPHEEFDPRTQIGVLPFASKRMAERAIGAPGQISPACGEAAYQSLRLATDLAMRGEVAGLVTAPLHKVALHQAGHDYPGHTEMLAAWTGALRHAMMLYLPPGRLGGGSNKGKKISQTIQCSEGHRLDAYATGKDPYSRGHRQDAYATGEIGLGVVHATLHMALRDVFRHLSTDRIYEKCGLAVEFVRAMLATDAPARQERVAVAALNPHGGESGLFGDEEQTIIAPAVLRAQSQGWNVVGPLPADTLIYRAVNGEFDAVVAMYHDQGHIPLKLIGFESAVNVTLGLPIVRTSVAHGTAFDIAWQGVANASSMVAATWTAARLCAARRSAVSDA